MCAVESETLFKCWKPVWKITSDDQNSHVCCWKWNTMTL